MFRFASPPNLARAAVAHPRRVVAAWVGLLVVSMVIVATLLSSATTTKVGFVTSPESAQAQHLITHTIGVTSADTEMVVVSTGSGKVTDPATRDRISSLAARIGSLGPTVVSRVESPFAPGAHGLVSADGSTALIAVTMAGDDTKAVDNIDKVLALTASASHDGLRAQVAGQAASSHDSNQTAKSDLSTGESIGIPVALLVLLVVFGTLASALLPIMLAIVAIIVTAGACGGNADDTLADRHF